MGAGKSGRRHRRHAVEGLKNLLIVLLTLSALHLAAQAFTDVGSWRGALLSRFGTSTTVPSADVGNLSVMAASPVRIVVRSTLERFAVQYDQEQTDELFDEVSSFLSEGLASAEAPRAATEDAWRLALAEPGVYFEFPGCIPLESLCVWMSEGAENANLSGSVRRVALSWPDEDTAALLYYYNETDRMYYTCQTSVLFTSAVSDALGAHSGNGASFAFEFTPGSGYDVLDPYVLIFSAAPEPRVYRASNPLSDTTLDHLLRSLSFRTQNTSSYSIAGGIRIREGKETLEILDSGSMVYHVSEVEASRYPVDGSGCLTDQIEYVRKLAAATVGSLCGGAQVYLIDAVETDRGAELTFGYVLDGASVQLYETGWAAQFLIQDGYVTDFTLHLRSYEDTGARSLVMRQLQAAAALEALHPEESRLSLCYVDRGGDTVEAGWIAG